MNWLFWIVDLYRHLFVIVFIIQWGVVVLINNVETIVLLLILIWMVSYVVIDCSHIVSLHIWFVYNHLGLLLILLLLQLLFLNHPRQLKWSGLVYSHELIVIIIGNDWLILKLNYRDLNASHVLLLLLINDTILWKLLIPLLLQLLW